MNRLLILSLLMITAWSCETDDGLIDAEVIPPKTLAEAAAEDDAEIKAYLETHFYNYEEFDSPPADFDFKIRFDTIAGDNSGKTALITQVESVLVNEASSNFGIPDGEEFEHTLYFLIARPGVGESPTIADNVVLQYEGSLLNGVTFDGRNTPLNQYLSGGLVKGYSNGVEKLNAGTGPIENGDGTVTFEDYGIGAIFIPSGLGYFSGPPQGSIIPAYAPLIFKVDVLAFEKDTDFDGDGIPSLLEDLDDDLNLNNDNTDGDSEPFGVFLPNHNDTDDDDDGLPTIEEINLVDGKFDSFKDTDGDGDDDHLDADDDNDGRPTRDEINIVDGSFDSFRDTDNDGIPDHLDKDS